MITKQNVKYLNKILYDSIGINEKCDDIHLKFDLIEEYADQVREFRDLVFNFHYCDIKFHDRQDFINDFIGKLDTFIINLQKIEEFLPEE